MPRMPGCGVGIRLRRVYSRASSPCVRSHKSYALMNPLCRGKRQRSAQSPIIPHRPRPAAGQPLLACRAPRLGSLAQMRLGKNLYQRNGEYWARLQSMIVKNRRELHYSLPAALTPYIDRYLSEIRPILLDPVATDAVWGNGDGSAYKYRSIGQMIFRQTQAETGIKFDEDFGAHRF